MDFIQKYKKDVSLIWQVTTTKENTKEINYQLIN